MIEKQDSIDFSRIPESKGLNNGTIAILIVGVIAIFAVGGLAIGLAGFGHMWPSTHSMRMDLGNMPAKQ